MDSKQTSSRYESFCLRLQYPLGVLQPFRAKLRLQHSSQLTESQLDVRGQALTFHMYLATTDKRVVQSSYWLLMSNGSISKDVATPIVLPGSWRR